MGDLIKAQNGKFLDLDKEFSPKNILVSPLNDSKRFLENDYLLTDNQEKIKNDILRIINDCTSEHFVGLTGAPGTGKTLLLYDLGKELSLNKKVLLIHGGMLCEGHLILEQKLKNFKICAAKDLKNTNLNDFDIILIDEAHRLYESALEKIVKYSKDNNVSCIFSYDPEQRLSHKENERDTVNRIVELCDKNIMKLTNKIRTNKEISDFINCLMNLNNLKNNKSNFEHISIYFIDDKKIAVEFAILLKKKDFKYISMTPSYYYNELDYQQDEFNTHKVIGQEFDKVCMIMDSSFYYEDNKLKSKDHPNSDYISTKLLYEGLTRAKSELALIVTDKNLLSDMMKLFKNNGEN